MCPLQEYFGTVTDFLRMEKIEFGGIRGQAFSDQVTDMFTEFTDMTTAFQGRGDNPVNITNTVRGHPY